MRLHAAFDDVADAKLAPDLGQLLRLRPIRQRRRARDHLQVTDLRQPRDDLVLHAVGEIGVRLVFAQVFERQDRDGAFRRARSAVSGPPLSAANADRS